MAMAILLRANLSITPDQTEDIEVMVGQILKIDSENSCPFCVLSNLSNLELAGNTEIDQILRAKLGSEQLWDVRSCSD